MLRRLFSIWIVVCTFGYGSAWAFDDHAEKEAAHHEILNVELESAIDNDDQSNCDHCCHAAAHMTGLCTVESLVVIHGKEAFNWSYDRSYRSLQTGPPHSPPIS